MNRELADNFYSRLSGYGRRPTVEVRIGSVAIGGGNPVAPQSMTNCSTLDTESCVEQIGRIREAGCRIVRLTAQNRKEAENLRNIIAAKNEMGLTDVAIAADIHFNPQLALIAARYADKVRINPGNYADPHRNLPLLIEACRSRGVALRIGVNHGSLDPRITEKWGDTPRGMVESAMEFLTICRNCDFDQVVVSMKSSNARVMVHACRLLVAAMDSEGMNCPLHLGVTEAGNGAEGRIKSAVGIGALLGDGIGDTIRVSLTEPPENEIPVCKAITDYMAGRDIAKRFAIETPAPYSPYEYCPRISEKAGNTGSGQPPVLWRELDAEALKGVSGGRIALLEAASGNPPAEWRSCIINMTAEGDRRPVILCRRYREDSLEALQIKAAMDFGSVFLDGLADGIRIENESDDPACRITDKDIDETALLILQASRARMSRTEYIACPGCGRTLFGLEDVLSEIKARTSHLKGLKIGVMGCIVNGPGEMADADYGYVGAGSGKVALYKENRLICRAVPQSEAVEALVDLIKEYGDWIEP